MNILKTYTFKWWQVGIFKLSVLSFGAAAGAYWNEFFSQYLGVLIAVAIVSGLYISFVSLKK